MLESAATMTQVLFDLFPVDLIPSLIGDAGDAPLDHVDLFVNDVVPSIGTTIGDLVFDHAQLGTAIAVDPAGWTSDYQNDGSYDILLPDNVIFTYTFITAPVTVYGFVAYSAGTTGAAVICRFTEPQLLTTTGQTVRFAPRFNLVRENTGPAQSL